MAHQEIQAAVESVNQCFVDNHCEAVGGVKVRHFKTLMGVFTVLGNKNMLLKGNVGSGKTTFTAALSSATTGLPYDLFDIHKIQGHVEQTKDTMFARLDLGRLAEEAVVWEPAMYLPTMCFDELNRLTTGKQSTTLEFVRNSIMSHYGKLFARDKFPFFATMNYNGAGTYDLSAALKDRFDISFEFPIPDIFDDDYVYEAQRNIESRIDRDKTATMTEYLLKKDIGIKEKLAYVQKQMTVPQKTRAALDTFRRRAEALQLTPGATTLLQCIKAECNVTETYGEKRPDDPIDQSDHSITFAHHNTRTPISGRVMPAATFYSKMLAAYTGAPAVTEEHLLTIMPYCLAHRIEFTDDYKAKFSEAKRLRGEHQALDLSRRLLIDIDENYRGPNGVANAIRTLDETAAELMNYNCDLESEPTPGPRSTLEKANQKLYDAALLISQGPMPDHPLLRRYYTMLKPHLVV